MAERRSRIRPGVALSFVLWIYGFLLLIPTPPSAWDRVKRYRGVDVGSAYSASQRAFEQELVRAVPDLAESRPSNAAFIALLKVEGPGRDVRYVILDDHIGPDPTGSTLQFNIVGERGALLSRTRLWMGWRSHFGSAEVVRVPDSNDPILRIRTPDHASIEVQTLYYGFRGDDVLRLREETVRSLLSAPPPR
jgi:hypothetical protein